MWKSFSKDGSEKRAVANTAVPAIVIANTIAGLGSVSDGKQGLLRLGATPYEFLGLVYDSTYGKWVSDPMSIGIVADASSAGDSGTGAWKIVTAGAGNTFLGCAILPLKSHTDAGLSLQLRVAGDMKRTGTSTHKLGVLVQTLDAGGQGSSIGSTIYSTTINSPTVFTGVDSGWQTAVAANDATAKSLGQIYFFTNSDGADTFFGRAGVMARWVG